MTILRHAEGHQRRLGAAIGEANQLGRRDQSLDPLSPFEFQLVASARMSGEADLPPDGLDHGRMAVTQKQGPMPHPVVNELIAVDIPLACAGRPIDVDGKWLEIPRVVGHPAGKEFAPALIQPL